MIIEKLKDILNEVVETVQQTVSDSDKKGFTDYDKKAIADMNKRREANRKKASKILAQDFSQKAARYVFYMDNNYDVPYSQKQWMELYEQNSASDDPQSLSPMYNAIVVDENGYYIRRGLEPMEHSYLRLSPGVNDDITNTFSVEPYTYKKVKCAKTVETRTTASTTSSVRTSSQSDNSLSISEKKEIEAAKRRYEEAMSRATGYNGSPVLADMYENAEKRAYADYMRVLSKYAGRK